MNLELNTIYTFKLNTGEELVAKLTKIEADFLEIEHPILTVISQQGLQMMPGLFSANLEKTMRLNNASWALIAETRDDVRDSWIQATTGITPVRKQIITG
jgi:SPX domain protein involved in polyphosphate accumulation